MKTKLLVTFAGIFCLMAYVTIMACLDRNVATAARDLWPDRWFRATLVDAYCGFTTFYLWVAYREASWRARVLWFALIMTLGNFAMSAYVIWKLVAIEPFSWESLLLRSGSSTDTRTGS